MESVFANLSDEGLLYSPYSSEQDSEDCDYYINPEYESNDDLDDPLGPNLVAPKDSALELSISKPPSVFASASALRLHCSNPFQFGLTILPPLDSVSPALSIRYSQPKKRSHHSVGARIQALVMFTTWPP